MTIQFVQAPTSKHPNIKWGNLLYAILAFTSAAFLFIISCIGVVTDFQFYLLQLASERGLIVAIFLSFLGIWQMSKFIASQKQFAYWKQQEPVKSYAKSLAVAIEKSTGTTGPWRVEG